MKVKITIPIEMTSGHTGHVSFLAELDAPMLETIDGKASIKTIYEPIIDYMDDEPPTEYLPVTGSDATNPFKEKHNG